MLHARHALIETSMDEITQIPPSEAARATWAASLLHELCPLLRRHLQSHDGCMARTTADTAGVLAHRPDRVLHRTAHDMQLIAGKSPSSFWAARDK